MTKRGQGGINAAILVAIIFGLILLYILAIPQKDRDVILDGNSGTTTIVSSGSSANTTLLKEAVGTIEDRDLDKGEHDIPSFTLFQTAGAKVLKKVPSFQVRNGIFDFSPREVRFSTPDASLTSNVLLSFSVSKAQGTLIIKLNGNNIFEGGLEGSAPQPISLSKEDLKDENVLEFSVSGVGWKFWTTNQYQVDEFLITADISDKSRQSSRSVFFVSRKEFDNLETSSFRFNPECSPSNVGILDVQLNSRPLFSGVPDCGTVNKVEFPPTLLEPGENVIGFTTTKGTYLIDQVQVKTELVKEVFPIFYFDVNETVFSDITNKTVDASVELDFVDDDNTKRLDLNINGHLTNVDQKKPTFSRKITSWIEEGNNYIEIRPKTRVNIVELRVILEEIEEE
ncbi:hypothetical protein HY638_04665 [Candidatus Woesearchaeota archaeon]|nr:hypothetical protein [Candidatus Woesearchaeota archaeon]